MGVRITGVGVEVPERIVTSTEVERRAGLSERFGVEPGWLEQLTGVHERRWAAPEVRPSALATAAGRRALDDARLDPLWLDTVVYAGITRDCLEPATASLVADALGAHNARVFDLSNADNGLVDAVDVADSLVRSGKARRVLVAAGERGSLAANWRAATFDEMLLAVAGLVAGDGGGAMVVEACEDPGRGIRSREFRSDATQWRHAIGGWFRDGTQPCEACGSTFERTLRCDGRALFSATVALLRPTMDAVMERTGWEYGDLDLVFCHEPTKRVVESALALLGGPASTADRLWITSGRYGNTTTMSLPLAMTEARAAGALRPGAKVLVLAPSAGVSAAAVTMVW
jgi:3-oxoacyl-[acyl-carrier-protein] synthase-3